MSSLQLLKICGAAHDVLGSSRFMAPGGFQIHRIRHLAREGRSKGRATGPAEDFPGDLSALTADIEIIPIRAYNAPALTHDVDNPASGILFLAY